MAGIRARWATAAKAGAGTAAVALAALAGLSGCSDGDSPSSTASKAASAASSLASRASGTVASATAEAGRRLDEVKNGVNVKDDVSLGAPATDSSGRTTVEVTARNTASATKSFAVQVSFKDPDGKLLDMVVVTVSDVSAGGTGTATARSTHKLSGQPEPSLGRALRY